MKKMRTLAIETSCDDTSVGIINFDWEVFSVEKIFTYTQVKEHNIYWWVVPEIASRLHSDQIIPVIEAIGFEAIQSVDNISVTTHPGLPGSLLVGETIATLLWEYFKKPIIEVNHVIWHIVSLFLDRKFSEIVFPLLILTVSGGHNDLYLVEKKWTTSKEEKIESNEIIRGNLKIKKLGTTLDDAAGECFDKVARMIGWPYPWGAWIWQQALKGNFNDKFDFNRIWLSKKAFDFSFSGLKWQIHTLIKNMTKDEKTLTEQEICDIAYNFQENVVEVLSKKLLRAGMLHQVKSIAISGGVSANDRWREYVNELAKNKQRLKNNQPKNLPLDHERNFELYKPIKKLYSTDNSAMIWVAGIIKERK